MAGVNAAALFREAFGAEPLSTVWVPGRVNLLGEHIDYTGGTVLPAALPLGVEVALSPRGDGQVRAVSGDFAGTVERALGAAADGHWSDYILGALQLAGRVGLPSGGADVAVASTLPSGAGLSSSAALAVAVLKALREVSDADMPDSNPSDPAIARLAQAVEREVIGVPCGIMDQMAVAVCPQGSALLLDTRNLHTELIALAPSHSFAVVHSGVRRELSEGRYGERADEAERLKRAAGTDDLSHLSEARVAALQDLPTPLPRRLRHMVEEHRRVGEGAEALRARDMARFGELMSASHLSQRDLLQTSVAAVDALVAAALDLGALGARLTGGGFGGAIVALLPRGGVEKWAQALVARHPEAQLLAAL